MTTVDQELRARMNALEHDLARARVQIARLRRQRHVAPVVAVVVLLVFTRWTTVDPLRAQAGGDLAARVAALEQKLATFEQGRPRLRGLDIVNAAGKPVISLSGAAGGGAVTVHGTNGDVGVALDGDGNLGVFSAGKGVASMRAEGGKGVLTVGQEGRRAAILTTTGDNEGLLTLNNAQGVIGAGMMGDGNVGVFDDGRGVVSLKVENGIGKVLVGNSQGQRLVQLSPDPLNAKVGYLLITDAAGKGVFRVGDTVKLADARVTIGKGAKGNIGINVADDAGSALVQMGQAQIGGGVVSAYNAKGTIRAIVSGTGQIHVAGDEGNTLATMVAEGGEGAFSIRNKGGTTIVRIGETSGGGVLQLADQGGSAMVEAGVLPGHGIVRAYPLGNPGVGLIGMPGTFISGFVK